MTCPRNLSDEQLLAYVRDPFRDPEGIADHLDRCPECDERADRLRSTLERPDISSRLVHRVLALDVPARPVPRGQGPRIDGYEDLEEIGQGGMGVVYKARHPRFGTVALKLIRRDALGTPDEAAGARREAEQARAAWEQAITSGDPSPPFARVFEFGETRDGLHYYISMELAQAGSLEGRLGGLFERPEVAAEILRVVARAVHTMHLRGVVHRDLKEKNILLRPRIGRGSQGDPRSAPIEDLDPIVADFGLSKKMDGENPDRAKDAETSPVDLKGTPYYIAPELIRKGPAGANALSDVFSLGVILYRSIAGERPFGGDSLHSIITSIVHDEPRRPRRINPRVPLGLESICLKCLEKDPRRRYVTAEALADDLGRFLRSDPDDPVRARLPGVGRRLGRWGRRNPVAVVALLALAVIPWPIVWGLRRELDVANARATLETEKVRARERSIHEERVHEARVAARRGDWPTAMLAYGRAIDDRVGDETRLRVDRLAGFFAVNDQAGLVAELDALERRPDLGGLAAPVALARGSLLLTDTDRQEQGRATIRKALETPGGLLSEADVHFARALAEAHASPMVESLRKALKLDPIHYQARASLIVALFARGELDESLVQADRLAELFPESAVPTFTRAIAAMIRGDRPAMRANLDATAARLKTDPAPLKDYFDAVAAALDVMAESENRPGAIDWTTRVRLAFLVPTMEAKGVAAAKPIAFAVPSISLVFRWYGEVFEVSRDANKADEASIRRLEALGRDRPEALIQSVIVGKKLIESCDHVSANRLREGRESLSQVADRAYRAADAPTILVRSPIRYQTRFIGLFADAGVLKLDPSDPGPRLRRMRDDLHRLVADGRRWKTSREQCIPYLLQMMTSSLTPALAADWKLDTPDGREAFRRRELAIARMGRSLLEDWVDDDPENPAARRQLDDLNRWAQAREKPANPPAAKP